MPRLGLQYRLCEVGPKRLDHQQFALETDELLRTGDILEPSPSVFISGAGDTSGLSEEIAEADRVWTSRNRTEDEDATEEVVESILGSLSSAGFSSSRLGADPSAYHHRGQQPSGVSRYVDLNSPRTAATLWVSWHETALSPTDPELWLFLDHCASRDRVPFILARAVSRLAFPVLRVLGAKALQYYVHSDNFIIGHRAGGASDYREPAGTTARSRGKHVGRAPSDEDADRPARRRCNSILPQPSGA